MGIGGRFGLFNGITFKSFMSRTSALEGLLSIRNNGFILTGLYEYQKSIKEVDGLDWYAGGGLHIAHWNNGGHYPYVLEKDRKTSYTIVGIDLILGAEYTIKPVPFSVALDWKPAINLIGSVDWWADGFALSIRYTFKK